jgi:hypothetical protein
MATSPAPLVAVYQLDDCLDVIRKARRESLVFPPYTVVHVTNYMPAIAHQGQEGIRVWVGEPGAEVREHYHTSLVDLRDHNSSAVASGLR